MFEGMTQFCRSCSTSPFDPVACSAGMQRFLDSLLGLNRLWREGASEDDAKALPFHIRPKAHMCDHLAKGQIGAFGNPADCWCYHDESFVGCIKAIAAGSKHTKTLETRVAEKCMLLSGIESYQARA